MKISLELDQTWDTAKELHDYLGLLGRALQRICEMEAEAPPEWFFLIRESKGEYTISLTHL